MVVDRTVLGKVSLSFAPAQKVAPLKRERRDPDKRRFERQLREEEEDGQADRVDIGVGSRENNEKNDPQFEGSAPDETHHEEAEKRAQGDDVSAVPGSILDIRV